MKFYITGRSDNYQLIKTVCKELKTKGHEVTFEWTELPSVKPYEENKFKAQDYSVQGIEGVVDADVYIIFAHQDGTGVYTEFVAALACHTISQKPKIFAIGEDKRSFSMFNYHPAITWKNSIDQVWAELGI